MFKLNEASQPEAFRVTPIVRLDYLALLRGESAPKGVIPFVWTSGSKQPEAIVWTDALFPLLVGEQALDVLRPLTGWSSFPIALRGKDGGDIHGYHLLVVRGRCGSVDFSRSQLVEKEYPGGAFLEYRGISFASGTWDGSDLFMPRSRVGFIFLSDRAQVAFSRGKIQCVEFEPLEDVQIDMETKALIDSTPVS